jgi:hypothetical protein
MELQQRQPGTGREQEPVQQLEAWCYSHSLATAVAEEYSHFPM